MITVRAYGDGPGPVVLLHGGPGAPGYMAPLARELAVDFRVVEPLQRTSGGGPLTVARHVADLAVAVPDPAVFVGHSWGAMLGLSTAVAHPYRVRALVLVGCGTYDPSSRAAYTRAMEQRLGTEEQARVEKLRARMAEETDPSAREHIFAQLAKIQTGAQCVEPLPAGWEVERADPDSHRETWDDVLRLQSKGVEPAAFAAITAPVVMIHGDTDPHPGPSTRDTLRRFIPHIEYVELERCGHLPWIERHAREPFLHLLRHHLKKFFREQ